MSTVFMVRLVGDYEKNVAVTDIQIPTPDGFKIIPAESKIFIRDDVDSARLRGWVTPAEVVEAYHDIPQKEQEPPAKDTIPTETKADLVIWIRDRGLADKFDLRRSKDDLARDVEAYFANSE
jgi:hypothetical protein